MSDQISLRQDTGNGPVIVLLQAADAVPSPAVAALARDFRVQVYGIGPAAAAGDVIKAIAAAQPVALVATAAAARVALGLALDEPRAVSTLVRIDPPQLDLARDAAITDRLAGLTTPLLVLVGTRGAAGLPPSARLLRKAMPHCHVMFVYDAGQKLDDERPEAVAAALAEFAHSRERYLVTTRSGLLHP